MTRADFLAAVTAAPDDDTPRLAFADYLEDEGDADWAELIRLQVGFFRDWSNFEAMNRRERELMTATKDRFPNPPGCELGPPARGFPQQLTVVGHRTPAYDAAFSWPIRRLRVPFFGTAFHAATYFPRVEVLELLPMDVGNAIVDIDLTRYRGLTHCRADQLKAFTWRQIGLGGDRIALIADEPSFAGLRELDLRETLLRDADAARLADSPYLGNLEYLNLAGNPILSTNRLERRFGAALRMV